MVRSLWPLPVAWALHVLLWLTWPAYTYGYKVPLPAVLDTLVIKTFHYKQIEDLADVRRYSWLFAGFIAWTAVALIASGVLRSRSRKKAEEADQENAAGSASD
jgi:hypothetical protein